MSDQCRDVDEPLILCQTEESLSNHEAASDSRQMFQDVRGDYILSMKMTYQDSIKECLSSVSTELKISMCL